MTKETKSDHEIATVVKSYGWYINNAFRTRIEDFQKSIEGAERSLNSPHNDGSQVYKDTEYLVEHVKRMKGEYERVWDDLKAVGIE